MNAQILKGAEGIKKVYEKVLKSNSADFACTANGYDLVLGSWYDDNFAPRLFDSHIKTRELLLDTSDNREYAKRKNTGKNAVRFVTTQSESDVITGDNFVAFVSYNTKNPGAVLIEDPEVVSSIKALFDLAWSAAKV
jgi:hypothetical protein